MAGSVPFRTWDWLEAWWRHYGDVESTDGSTSLLVLTVEEVGKCIGIMPWYVWCSPWSGRTIRFLGTGEVCSEYLAPMAAVGKDARVVEAVAEWLDCDGASLWDMVELNDVDGGDPVLRGLAVAMTARGCKVHWRPGARCWRVTLPPTWEEYLRQLSSSHRKQVRRMERRFFETGRAQFHTVQSELELQTGMSILVRLHQERQESLGRVGCFASQRFAEFHHEVARRLLACQTLRLHWLELDGRPIAAEYHLAGGRGIFVYQGGIDPASLAESPGQLITLTTIKRAIEQGYRYFDFLRGDERYKAHWAAQPRPTVKVRIVPNRLVTRLRHNVWLAGKRIQTFVRGVPGFRHTVEE